jgi:hypothetical protein
MDNETIKITDSRPTFYSMWRPAIGHVSLWALGLNFVVFPLIEAGFTVFRHPILMPKMDVGPIVGLITGILGLGGMRTYEKIKNVGQG